MAVDRNTQLNPQGDPAKEQEFINNQQPRTAEGARASEPQLAVTQGNEDLMKSIRAADILDPEQGDAFEAKDAPPGAEQGANVNAQFEDEVRTGADESGETGEQGEGGAPLTSGRFQDNDPEKGPEHVTLKGEEEQGKGNIVETGDEARTGESEKGKRGKK